MRNILILLVCFGFGGLLYAQDPKMDTVRPGIKSIARYICGYGAWDDSARTMAKFQRQFYPPDYPNTSSYNGDKATIAFDSTGLTYYSSARYNQAGIKVNGYTTGSLDDKTGESWFYAASKLSQGRNRDSVVVRFDAQGRIAEEWHYDVTLMNRYVFTYNNSGQLIRREIYHQTYTSPGWTIYLYDKKARLVSSVSGNSTDTTDKEYITYDSQDRILTHVKKHNHKPRIWEEKTENQYSANELLITESSTYGSRTKLFRFTPYDSVQTIINCYTEGNDRICDTTLYTRDPVTHLVTTSEFRSSRKSRNYTEQYEYRNGKLNQARLIHDAAWYSETFFDAEGRPMRKINYQWNAVYSTESWKYNSRGDRTEYLMVGSKQQIIQRELYIYTYY